MELHCHDTPTGVGLQVVEANLLSGVEQVQVGPAHCQDICGAPGEVQCDPTAAPELLQERVSYSSARQQKGSSTLV